MVNTLLPGMTLVADSYVDPKAPEYPGVEPYIVRYAFDPRRAVESITELGYSRGQDGKFRDAAGEPLSVGYRTITKDINAKSMYAVADYWGRIGVDVETEVVPQARASDIRYRATYPSFEQAGVPKGLANLTFYTKTPALPENNFIGGYHTRYKNAELEALIDRYYVTIPFAERVQLLGNIIRIATDQLIVAGLFYEPQPTPVSNRILNLTSIGPSAANAWNAHELDIR